MECGREQSSKATHTGTGIAALGLATLGLATLGLALLGLAGCAPARRPAGPSTSTAPPATTAPPVASAARYEVIGSESLVVVLAYRGGPLASFGHNHVITSRSMTGFIQVGEPLTTSTFELHLPVAGFTVDDPALRNGRGPDFAPAVPDAAREGTRENMLGKALLDAAEFPEIAIRSVALSGGPADFIARLDVTLRGGHHPLEVPVTVEQRDADRLQAHARFPVTQTSLGLAPFSVMLGALRVEDRLDVEVDLVARRPVTAGATGGDGPSSTD